MRRVNVFYLLIALLALVWLQSLWSDSRSVADLPYSRFRTYVDGGQVQSVEITPDEIHGTFKTPIDGKTRFRTTRVELDLARDLEEHGIEFVGKTDGTFLPMLLSWVVPVVLFVGIWLLLMNRIARRAGQGPGFLSIGKSKAKVYVETDTEVTFADVAGVDEAKIELQEVVEFLRDPGRYGRLGARMPKGVLLVGPPGTGKTLLARAVAGEAEVPFFSISGSEFVEMFVGVGAARVRDLFEQARQKAPCIIFIDELDALGRARAPGPMAGGGHDEKEQTLNQLLVELDGFDPTAGIVLLAATNRPEILDPALLRAGRFDRQVLVDRPDKVGRQQVLAIYLKKVPLADDVVPADIAALTAGFTGADLANLVNEAALVATRRDSPTVAMRDFNEAVERIVAGLEKRNRVINDRERRVVAHHEMGHAIVAAALPGQDQVHKVSIIPRGIGALGYTIQRPTDDRYLMTRAELEDKMAVLLGGRAAEQIVFDHLSTGAADDLTKVTNIARSMVTRYAMHPELGHVSYEDDRPGFLGIPGEGLHRSYSEETAREIDCAIRDLIAAAFDRARGILVDNRALLDRSAERLLAEETLTGDELEALLDGVARPAARA